jgi:hypothetical protein
VSDDWALVDFLHAPQHARLLRQATMHSRSLLDKKLINRQVIQNERFANGSKLPDDMLVRSRSMSGSPMSVQMRLAVKLEISHKQKKIKIYNCAT